MSKKLELHDSRLGTTDAKGARVAPQPEDVKGKWASRRKIFYSILIAIYLVLPWIYVNGKQWVLLDIPGREFTFFGSIFYAHDGIFLIFLFLGFGFLIAFVTSVWGRVWCGWACPQTVFIDQVYRKIERWIEGNSRRRKALNKQHWNFEKIWKKGAKWALFLLVSLHIVHSFLGYFVGTRELLEISFQSPANNWVLFVTMLVLTGIVLFDFGWFREQFCVIACPYGRFQSVMMDENSTVVAYDEKRGEPRRNKAVSKDKEGDCIDCFKCVKVCPTGIDIRRGTQMECIACTMCIDACDEIMEKVGYEKGLIRYASENELNGKKKRIGVKSFILLGLFLAVVGAMIASLSKRDDLSAQFLRMPGEPYQKIIGADGFTLLNRFEAKIDTLNKKDKRIEFRLPDNVKDTVKLVSGELPKVIESDKETVSFFLKYK
ncbi:MAG: cytochrome c oxidase accessory protein CcoG, partial [Bacteriovoracaceae bacterium]